MWAIFLVIGAGSEPATAVAGEVREAFTRVPLSGVSVAVKTGAEERTTESDANGGFRIVGVQPGTVEIVFADLTHLSNTTSAVVEDGNETRVVVYLRRAQSAEYETVVLGKRDRTQVSQVTLGRAEIERSPGSFGDPVRAAQNLPGVARAPLFLGSFNMRGTWSRDSQMLIDGVPLPMLYHAGIGPSVIPDSLAEEVVLSPGGFGVQYGRSSAGVVDVRLRSPSTERLSGKVAVDFLMPQAFFNVPLSEKVAVSASVRRSYLDLIAKPILAQQDNVIPFPSFTDYHVAIGVTPSSGNRFDLLLLGSYDSLVNVGRSSWPDTHWMFHALKPSWELKAGRVVNKITALGAYVNNGLRTNAPSLSVQQEVRTQQWQGFLRDDLKVAIDADTLLLAGIDGAVISDKAQANDNFGGDTLRADDPLTELNQLFYGLYRPAQPPQISTAVAAYAALERQIGPVRIVPSLRAEVFGYTGQWLTALQPRVSVTAAVSSDVRLFASSGSYQKPPALTLWTELGPAAVPLMTSWQTSVGAEWQITQALSAQVTGYFNQLWNDVTLSLTRAGTLGTNGYTRANGRVYGGELFVRHRPFHNLQGTLSYALSRSERFINDQWVLSEIDQTHTLTLLASYVFPHGIQLGARFRLSAGAPYSPALFGVFVSGLYVPVRGSALRTARLPMFHQLDLRIDKTWVFDLFRLTAYIDIINVYMNRMPSGVEYTADYSRSQDKSLLFPILPLLGVMAEF